MRVERARYFLAAVETGSLRSAAARCEVSQPALGEQVALLEEELDVVLLTRSRSGVRPTQAGLAMIGPMTRLVEAEDDARRAAADSGGAYRGQVAIGSISAAVESVIAPAVARLRTHHRGLHFTISEGSTPEIERRVLHGELDFGVVTEPGTPPASGLRRTVLSRTPLGVIVPIDHPLAEREELTWADLAPWPVVTMREGTVMWERLRTHLPDADVVVQGMSARSLEVMVAHGAGIGVLARLDSADAGAGGRLRWIPLRGARPVALCLVQRSDSRPSPSALIVRRLVQDRADELFRLDRD